MAVPDNVLTNADLEKMVDTSDEWITTRTGIKERRIAPEELTTSELAAQAGAKALQHAGVDPETVDLIIVATVTPEMLFPSTACLVQDKLGCTQAGAFDLSAGCSGFVYGLDIASQMIASGNYRHVLVIGVDLLSRVTDFTDRSTCVLFGDGAGAALLGPVSSRGVMATWLGADGSGGDKLCIPGSGPGAAKRPADTPTIAMAGNDVFKFAVRIMGEAAATVIEKAGLQTDDIDLFVPHQANIRIIDAAARRLELPPERVFINVEKYGNTSAASIPLALAEAHQHGRISAGDSLVLVGFGAGLTWASAAIEWAEEVRPHG